VTSTTPSLTWTRENPAYWDEPKARIVGLVASTFPAHRRATYRAGQVIPDEWWRVEQGGRVVGYGWMDTTWGDAEILLAVEPDARERGVGQFIVERLEAEARARGLHYLHNVLPDDHPERERVRAWLERRGFQAGDDGQLARAVVSAGERATA
jgi:N-acetylglutamate synthase-like GNAT family acetyltransferase